jgi:hypothetical protein
MASLINNTGGKMKYLSNDSLGAITKLPSCRGLHPKNKRTSVMEVFHVVTDKYILIL